MTEIDGLTHLAKLAEELCDAEIRVVEVAADLKIAQQRVRQLAEFSIPELMEGLEMESFKTRSGISIDVKNKLSARKLTQKHAAALEWLRTHDQAGLIKTLVGVPFSAGSESDADALVEELAGEGFAASKTMEVHHSSLAAAIRSMKEEGVDVPMELLGGYERRVATVSTKK